MSAWNRVYFLGASVLMVHWGRRCILTRHLAGISNTGARYTADGSAAVSCGWLLCGAAILIAIVAIFWNSDFLNRPFWAKKSRLP